MIKLIILVIAYLGVPVFVFTTNPGREAGVGVVCFVWLSVVGIIHAILYVAECVKRGPVREEEEES